ncbi:MAG: permease [Candidatus Geothermincolia bacterium]
MKKIRWDIVSLVIAAGLAVGLSLAFPDKGSRTWHVSLEYLREMIFILPAVMLLMGLFAVWVDRSLVVKLLGEESGAKGITIAILMGTLPSGPLYVMFPLAAMLLAKGARVANVLVFLASCAAIKLQLELMELQFLGWKFTLLRLALTVALVIPMGLAGEALYHRARRPQPAE